jgi:hypothetical protein
MAMRIDDVKQVQVIVPDKISQFIRRSRRVDDYCLFGVFIPQ